MTSIFSRAGIAVPEDTVLIIDDHPALRRGIKTMVEDLGLTAVKECGTFDEATKIQGFRKWKLVILDIHLPDGDGVDLLLDMRKHNCESPVLVHTMLPDTSAAARAFKAGCNGFINKCASPDDFSAAVRRLLAGGRYVSPEFAEELALGLTGVSVSPHEKLSEREYQVMCLMAQGNTPGTIAHTLDCHVNTISTYRARILKKLGVKTSMDIIRYALSKRLVS